MPLRVLFVTTTYPLHPGDAIPGFVADLARTLASHHEVRIKVLAPHHPGAAKCETMDGIEIERFQYTLNPAHQCIAYGNGIPDNLRQIPRANRQVPGFLIAMAAAVWKNLDSTDLIHAHWVEPAFVASVANFLQHKPLRKPLVMSVHSLNPKKSLLHKYTFSAADRVLFNSAYTMSQAHAKGYACKSDVIYQGYDDRLFGTLDRSGHLLKNALGIPPDSLLVSAVGRMIDVKGFHILAEAADAFLNGRPHVHLVFAGDGPSRPEIESIVAQSPNRARIHFAGALHRQQVAQLLADSDIFVNPGVIDPNGRAEGLGITTIEAMATGLPVIGSRVGGISETIVDQLTGILVPPGDRNALSLAIGKLLDDPQMRARMGQHGQSIAKERFSWPALASEVMRVYSELSPPPGVPGGGDRKFPLTLSIS